MSRLCPELNHVSSICNFYFKHFPWLGFKTGLEDICLGFFIFSFNEYNLIIQLASYVSAVSSAVGTFIVLWDEPAYALLISVRVLC
jgi:hypothetical protein